MKATPLTREQKRTLSIVFFTVFLDLIGFGIIIPIQPFYAETLGASPAVVTLLGACFSLMQFLFAPVWGRLSDRVGRRPIMLISIALGSLGYLMFGFARTLPLLFFARILSGMGSGNIGTAQAIIADSTPNSSRARGMGLIGAAFGMGFLFGPALGGGLGQIGLSAPAFGASILCALNWISAFFFLPETLSREQRAAKTNVSAHSRLLSFGALREAIRYPNVGRIFLAYLVFASAFSLVEQVLGLFIERTWLADKIAVGLSAKPAAAMTAEMLMLVGITATLIQGVLIGRIVGRFGEKRVLVAGTLLVTVSFINVILSGMQAHFGWMLANSVVMAMGTGLTNPALSTLLSKSADPASQGGVLGLGQACAALGRIIGPVLSGALFEMSRNLPFEVGAVLMCACTAVALSLRSVRVQESVI